MTSEDRGSEKLRDRFGGCTLEPKDLEALVVKLERHGFRLNDWLIKGQPRPDWVTGSIDVPRAEIGKAIQVLAEVDGVRINLDGFPIGIPFPDIYRIGFRGVGQPG